MCVFHRMCVGLAGLILPRARRNAVLLRRDHLIKLVAITWANLGFVPVGGHQGLQDAERFRLGGVVDQTGEKRGCSCVCVLHD